MGKKKQRELEREMMQATDKQMREQQERANVQRGILEEQKR